MIVAVMRRDGRGFAFPSLPIDFLRDSFAAPIRRQVERAGIGVSELRSELARPCEFFESGPCLGRSAAAVKSGTLDEQGLCMRRHRSEDRGAVAHRAFVISGVEARPPRLSQRRFSVAKRMNIIELCIKVGEMRREIGRLECLKTGGISAGNDGINILTRAFVHVGICDKQRDALTFKAAFLVGFEPTMVPKLPRELREQLARTAVSPLFELSSAA